LGHTIAAAGLAAVTKAALALHHRHLPAQAACPNADPLDLSGTAFRFTRTTEPWLCPEADLPRRAAVVGSSLTGTVCYLLLDEPVPKAAATAAAAIPAAPAARRPQPIAVLAAAGSFADRRCADDFWQA